MLVRTPSRSGESKPPPSWSPHSGGRAAVTLVMGSPHLLGEGAPPPSSSCFPPLFLGRGRCCRVGNRGRQAGPGGPRAGDGRTWCCSTPALRRCWSCATTAARIASISSGGGRRPGRFRTHRRYPIPCAPSPRRNLSSRPLPRCTPPARLGAGALPLAPRRGRRWWHGTRMQLPATSVPAAAGALPSPQLPPSSANTPLPTRRCPPHPLVAPLIHRSWQHLPPQPAAAGGAPRQSLSCTPSRRPYCRRVLAAARAF